MEWLQPSVSMDVPRVGWRLQEYLLLRRISQTFRSISAQAEVLVPLKAQTIIPLGWIKESSTSMRPNVMIGQTFKADPFSINTLEMIIPLHSTIISNDLTCPVPFGVNSSSIESYHIGSNDLSHYLLKVLRCSSFRDIRFIQNFWQSISIRL